MSTKASSTDDTTVGILHCGDMGSAIGLLLRSLGRRVVTTGEGRSPATRERARGAGIEMLPSVEAVVAESHVVFSFVLPTAAVEVAQRYADCGRSRPDGSVFVEANSIGPDELQRIERLMSDQSIPLVDAAVHGGALRLRDIGILYLSGRDVRVVEEIFAGALRVERLDERIGSASRMKLLLAGISKTLIAVFLEVGVLSERSGTLDPFLAACRHFYPGIMAAIERTLPTYPRHAPRRIGELRSVERLAQECNSRSGIVHEAARLLELVAGCDWDRVDPGLSGDIRTIVKTVEQTCRIESRPA